MSDFLTAAQESLADGCFVKISLGHYTGNEQDLKKIIIRRVVIKQQDMLGFTYRYKTRDIVKNYGLEEGFSLLAKNLSGGFQVATLFTTEFDLAYEISGKKSALKKSAPTERQAPSTDHDRAKNRKIESAKPYLHDLGITDVKGSVHKAAQDKFRQINRYVEILDPYLKELPQDKKITVADMGSGKGYLTFALYDHMTSSMALNANVTGVEMRRDMVELCNDTAGKSGFSHLNFVENSIADYAPKSLDVLIALHACDTATDDAIAKGIESGAQLIVVAPCCHKQIRREMEKGQISADVDSIVRHGIFAERQAEMVTDSMRALLLEHAGYKTKVFEFISNSHTPKNILIVATKRKGAEKNQKAYEEFLAAKKFFGVSHHYLEGKIKP